MAGSQYHCSSVITDRVRLFMSGNHSTTDGFFKSQKEKSRVKTYIVTEFFKAYFPIINSAFSNKDIWYIDLFCGPGQYDDGSKSTPIVLLDIVEQFGNNDIREKLHIIFNDRDPNYIERLKSLIINHPVLPKLKYKPVITNLRASDVDLSIYTKRNNPIFSFVDPWGYKDVTVSQVWKLVKNIGSDCVLFFNSGRILQDISKPANITDFEQLFGPYYADAKQLQKRMDLTQRQKAEQFVVLFSKNLYKTVSEEANGKYKIFVLPFYVEADDKEKISHYIVFVSKSHKAIQEMKKVMIKYGNSTSSVLGYDDKTSMQISLLNRDDDTSSAILTVIKSFLLNYPNQYNKSFTVGTLAETLDRYAMFSQYKVLPFSIHEIKQAIELLDSQGHIDVIEPKGKRMNKRITNDRWFRFKKSIEGA